MPNGVYNLYIVPDYHGSRISMIRDLRNCIRSTDPNTGETKVLSLQAAKSMCEQMEGGYPAVQSLRERQVEMLQMNGFSVTIEGTPYDKFKRLPQVTVYRKPDGKKIEAIKDLRRATGWGLRESKDFIDEMWRLDKPVVMRGMNQQKVFVLRENGFTVQGFIDECFKGQEDLFTI